MNHKKGLNAIIVLALSCACLLLNSCMQSSDSLLSRVKINVPFEDSVLNFAKVEIEKFLGEAETNSKADQNNWIINFVVDTNMASYSFSVNSQTKGNKQVVDLSGSNSTCVLHAAYTMLEKAGYQFEISGPAFPHELQMKNLINWSETVRPVVLKRGIRQHINFPMDISSYAQEEAKEYIHNLARLRFNSIVFHSYPNQWVEGPQAGTNKFAGAYFYGQRHDIPQDTLVSNHIRNKKTYCIPEIEAYIDQPEECSKRSVEWLNAVRAECKKAGMFIQFSFEPRDTALNVTGTLNTCEAILKSYPLIDNLEIISQETGKWSGQNATAKEIQAIVEKHFDKNIFSENSSISNFQNSADPSLVSSNKQAFVDRDYLRLLAELGHNVKATKELLAQKKHEGLKINLGVYCVVPEYLKACL